MSERSTYCRVAMHNRSTQVQAAQVSSTGDRQQLVLPTQHCATALNPSRSPWALQRNAHTHTCTQISGRRNNRKEWHVQLTLPQRLQQHTHVCAVVRPRRVSILLQLQQLQQREQLRARFILLSSWLCFKYEQNMRPDTPIRHVSTGARHKADQVHDGSQQLQQIIAMAYLLAACLPRRSLVSWNFPFHFFFPFFSFISFIFRECFAFCI